MRRTVALGPVLLALGCGRADPSLPAADASVDAASPPAFDAAPPPAPMEPRDSGLAPEPAANSNPGVVDCPGAPSNVCLSTTVCCTPDPPPAAAADSGLPGIGGGTATCTEVGQCHGGGGFGPSLVYRQCDERPDCPPGSVCCANGAYALCSPADECTAGKHLCKANADCDGERCLESSCQGRRVFTCGGRCP